MTGRPHLQPRLVGTLDEVVPMSDVEFRNVNVPCHLNSHVPCRFKGALLSHVKLKRNTPCHVPYIFNISSRVTKLYVSCRF